MHPGCGGPRGICSTGEGLDLPSLMEVSESRCPQRAREVGTAARDPPVVAGLRLDTSHHGTDTGPNRGEDGPRWRILDGIPAWAHWTVRHPPGL